MPPGGGWGGCSPSTFYGLLARLCPRAGAGAGFPRGGWEEAMGRINERIPSPGRAAGTAVKPYNSMGAYSSRFINEGRPLLFYGP
ncbi:hypothetical protein SUGI_1474480, partial [Cryptomeria japonica]